MRKNAVLITLLILFAAGCQNEGTPSAAPERDFIGTIENSGTKISLSMEDGTYTVNWSEGDRIRVEDETNSSLYKAMSGGSVTTSFKRVSGMTPAGAVTAYSPDHIRDGYPEVQEYVKGNIAFNPMMAVSNDNTLNFKNLGSILEIDASVPSGERKLLAITVSADQSLCGPFEVVNGAAVVSGAKEVTLTCGGTVVGNDTEPFFIALPSGEYTGLTVRFIFAANMSQSFILGNNGAVTLERSKLYRKQAVCDNLVKVIDPAILVSGTEFNAAVKSMVMSSTSTDAAENTFIRKIVFDTASEVFSGNEIQAADSPCQIFLNYDDATSTVTISTPADKIVLPKNASYMFANLGALEEISNLKCLVTDNCTDMSYMFNMAEIDSSRLLSLDLSGFNTAKCTTMRSMFNGLKSLKSIDVSSFNTAKVTNFSYMFQHLANVPAIDCSSFNTANATTLAYMFAYDYKAKEIDVSSFNTAKCTAINHIFAYCTDLLAEDLSHFNTAKCTQLCDIFWHCHSIRTANVKGWVSTAATDMRSFFNRCDVLETVDVSTLSGTKITDATYCNYFFYLCKNLREINAGSTFMFGCTGGSSFFCANNTAYASRPGSAAKGLTVICSQAVADWLATTNLRWIANGNGAKAIPVTFKDYQTGETLKVKWATN